MDVKKNVLRKVNYGGIFLVFYVNIYLKKKSNKTVESFCLKFDEFVKTYSNELEYKKIKGLK